MANREGKRGILFFLLGVSIVSLLSGLSSCCSNPGGEQLAVFLNQRIKDPMDSTRILKVYFATDRKVNGGTAACSNASYSIQKDSSLHYGSCEVNVPVNHPVGAIDQGGPDTNRDNYFQLGDLRKLDSLSMMAQLDEMPDDILVFVHGFNVKFEEAVVRSAQIAYDSKFQGGVVLFSWPSGSGEGMFDSLLMNRTYEENKKNAAASIDDFKTFLTRLLEKKKRIYLVVHSMGHQVVLPALASMSKSGKKGFLQELVMNAPDYSRDAMQGIGAGVAMAAKRTTLYCSPSDNALAASKLLNDGGRAGSCMRIGGIDVIDVERVDEPVAGIGGTGHGYYSSRPLMTDFYQLFLGIDARRRLFIQKSPIGSDYDYILRN